MKLEKLMNQNSHTFFFSSYNVTNSPKVTAIIEVLVFKSEIIPDESSEYFKWCQDWKDKVGIYVPHLNEAHWKSPSKTKYQIFNNRQIVELKVEKHKKKSSTWNQTITFFPFPTRSSEN